MNTLLLISVCGLVFKLIASYDVVTRYPARFVDIKTETMLFIFSFIAYSVTLIFVFSPTVDNTTYGIDRATVVRAHYFMDGVCLATAATMLLSLIGARIHRTVLAKIIIGLYIGVGGYFLLGTDAFISSRVGVGQEFVEFGGVASGDYLLVPRILVGLCLILVTVVIIRRYAQTEHNRLQVLHLYALLAFLLYAINCFSGLFMASPVLVALRGIVFFTVVMFMLQRSRLYDLRSVIPATDEYQALRKFRRSFRAYANDDNGYRDTLRQFEKAMLDYKIAKVSRFGEPRKSSLPRVAESMGLSLSTLYDLIKRLDLKRRED